MFWMNDVSVQFPEERNHDLTQMYRMYFTRNVNPTNLSLLIDAYVRRTDLGIARETDTIKVPVLNITGALSPHVDDTVTFNGRLNPNNSTWMKVMEYISFSSSFAGRTTFLLHRGPDENVTWC